LLYKQNSSKLSVTTNPCKKIAGKIINEMGISSSQYTAVWGKQGQPTHQIEMVLSRVKILISFTNNTLFLLWSF